MIHERKEKHSACALGDKLYVFGGPFEADANFCVEKLDAGKLLNQSSENVSWTEIRLKNKCFLLGKRSIVASISSHEILIVSKYTHNDRSRNWS